MRATVVGVTDIVALPIWAGAPAAPAPDTLLRLPVIIRCPRADHPHALARGIELAMALPGSSADTCEAQSSSGTAIVEVPDIVALPIGAGAPAAPATHTTLRFLVNVRRVAGRSLASYLHALARGIELAVAFARRAADASEARWAPGAFIMAVADIVALPIRAGTPAAPSSNALRLLIVVAWNRQPPQLRISACQLKQGVLSPQLRRDGA